MNTVALSFSPCPARAHAASKSGLAVPIAEQRRPSIRREMNGSWGVQGEVVPCPLDASTWSPTLHLDRSAWSTPSKATRGGSKPIAPLPTSFSFPSPVGLRATPTPRKYWPALARRVLARFRCPDPPPLTLGRTRVRGCSWTGGGTPVRCLLALTRSREQHTLPSCYERASSCHPTNKYVCSNC